MTIVTKGDLVRAMTEADRQIIATYLERKERP